MNRWPLILGLVALTTVACGGDTEAPEPKPAPSPEAPSATPAVTYAPDDVTNAKTSCSLPHGNVAKYATVDELTSMLAGSWLYCSDGAAVSLNNGSRGSPTRVGVEMTSDGHFYWLSRDAFGNVVRGQGITEAAGYTILPPTGATVNDVSFQIDAQYADRFTMSTRATFETGPRRLALLGWDGFFVRLSSPHNP